MQGAQHAVYGENLRQDDRLAIGTGRVEDIQRYTIAVKAVEKPGNLGVVARPVAHHKLNVALCKGTLDGFGFQYALLIGQTGNAPAGGEIQKYPRALFAQRRQAGFGIAQSRTGLRVGVDRCAKWQAQGGEYQAATEDFVARRAAFLL